MCCCHSSRILQHLNVYFAWNSEKTASVVDWFTNLITLSVPHDGDGQRTIHFDRRTHVERFIEHNHERALHYHMYLRTKAFELLCTHRRKRRNILLYMAACRDYGQSTRSPCRDEIVLENSEEYSTWKSKFTYHVHYRLFAHSEEHL